MVDRGSVLVPALVFGLLTATAGSAQELESFDLSDFLDPRLLVHNTASGEEQPETFLWSRFVLGFLDGYQRRDLLNEDGVGYRFARLTGSLHHGRYQANLELLGMDRLGLQDDQITDVRVQVARYFYTEGPAEAERVPARVLVSWRAAGPERLGFEDELSVSVERVLSLGPLEKAIGSDLPKGFGYLFGSSVYTYQPERGDHYLSYAFRGTVRRWEGGSRIRLGVATGVEDVADHTRWGPTRLELSFVGRLPIFNSNIHIVYAPTYHPHPIPGNDHFGYELGVFTDIPLGSRLFSPRFADL